MAAVAPRLIDNVARFSSPFTQATRTFARPGDRWGFKADFQNLQGVDRSRLEAFIANMRGAANRALFAPNDYTQRGSFPAPELVTNGNFAGGTTGWTSSGATFTVADRLASVKNSGAANGRITNTAAILPAASPTAYVLRVVTVPGNQSAYKINVGTTTGATDITTQTPANVGYNAYTFAPGAVNVFISLVVNTIIPGDFITGLYVSFARCFRVNGGSQVGSTLVVDALPLSTANLLLPGDWVGIGMELKRVTAPLNSDGSGNGTLQFAPPLRASPLDNDGIIVNQPFGRFILSASENGWQSTPGIFAAYSMDLVEAP
jgi:hypothetical protein